MEVLLELAKHPGEVVSKAGILQSVWKGVFVCEDVVANAVSLLRRALGDQAHCPFLIQTISKRGYRLIGAIRPVPEPPISGLPDSASVPGPRRQHDQLEQCILRVRHLRHEETIPSLNSACAYSQEIIRQEPNCAAAYAELVLALFLLEKLGAATRTDIEPKIRNAVDRALCLDERSSMSLVCLAKQEYRYDWKWDQAEQHFKEAVRAGPEDADAFAEFSIMLSVTRRFDEGLAHARQACLLDPISPAARLQLGHANYASEQWAAAVVHYERILRFSPLHVFARWGLVDSLNRAGRPHEAIAALREGLSMAGAYPNPLLLTSLSRLEAMIEPPQKHRSSSYQLLNDTSDPVLRAELSASIGEISKAFRFLDQAADLRHYRLSAVNMFPPFDPLRADPRYDRFLERIGLR